MHREYVEKLFKLTNLSLEEKHVTELGSQIYNILDWCKCLNSIDTKEISPLFNILDIIATDDIKAPMRQDIVKKSNSTNEILSQAAEHNDLFICVPKIIE